jgi:hypothetical protein
MTWRRTWPILVGSPTSSTSYLGKPPAVGILGLGIKKDTRIPPIGRFQLGSANDRLLSVSAGVPGAVRYAIRRLPTHRSQLLGFGQPSRLGDDPG